MQGVEKIHQLELEHKRKLALLAEKQQEVANLKNQYEEVSRRSDDAVFHALHNLCSFKTFY